MDSNSQSDSLDSAAAITTPDLERTVFRRSLKRMRPSLWPEDEPQEGAFGSAFEESTPTFGASSTPAFGASSAPISGTPAFGATSTPAIGASPAFGPSYCTSPFSFPGGPLGFGAWAAALSRPFAPRLDSRDFGLSSSAFGAPRQPFSAFGQADRRLLFHIQQRHCMLREDGAMLCFMCLDSSAIFCTLDEQLTHMENHFSHAFINEADSDIKSEMELDNNDGEFKEDKDDCEDELVLLFSNIRFR